MPRRSDIAKILVIGSGPIAIGQACEFDYSGAQACKVLRGEGYEVVLVNSNPATIMTDPELSSATYVEPITAEYVAMIIERERPDACLPTLGGQTGLNVAMELAAAGVLECHGVEMLGATPDVIRRAEDRRLFKEKMLGAGLDLPRSRFAHTVDQALEAASEIGYPVVVRPSYVLGGGGSAVVADAAALRAVSAEGLRLSPIAEVLIEESIEGWKEFELELMRDVHDNVVVVCSIENVDPMGVHTGDSVTVAPAMTLTDVEYQAMRNDGATVMLSPVCTPIGSTFSIEQMTTKLSATSRITSSSNSFQPITDSSSRIS